MIAVLLSVRLVAQAPQEAGEWVVVESKADRLSFAMPVRPREATRETQTPAGPVKSTAYLCQRGASILAFRHDVLPRGIGLDDAVNNFEAMMKKNPPGQVEFVKRDLININGVPGRELYATITFADGRGKDSYWVLVLTIARDVYLVLANSGPGQPMPPDAAAFFNSVRFDGKPADKPVLPKPAAPKAAKAAKAATPAKPAPVPPKRKLIGKIDRVDTTSDAALRTFLMAMEAGDEETLRAVTLPNPDLDWLLRGETPRGLGLADVKERMLKARITRLKAGDRVKMPGGAVHAISPDEVGRDRAALRVEGTPVYAPLQRVKGRWKVDPAPIIATRKAEAVKPDAKD
jgi:hypothetical protein